MSPTHLLSDIFPKSYFILNSRIFRVIKVHFDTFNKHNLSLALVIAT